MRWMIACLLGLTLGCEAPPVETLDESVTVEETAELVVLVWSDHLKQAVPAEGILYSEQGERPIDTRGNPAAGQTFSSLPAGRYRIKIKARFRAAGAPLPVSGEAVLYLEPGDSQTATVTVSDRAEDKFGWLLPRKSALRAA